MGIPIRILIIEDSEEDVLLIIRNLKKNGFDVEYKIVTNATAMKKELKAKEWDLVLSDYSMPGFDGLSALKIFQSFKREIPFILISGTIGEDVAVTAMKKGVHDYIMKDELIRLAPAIKRELKEAEIRKEKNRAEKALQDEKNRASQIIESMIEGVTIMEPDGTIRQVNKEFERGTGWKKNEVIGKTIFDIGLIAKDEMKHIQNDLLPRLMKKGFIRNIEMMAIRKDGTCFPVLLNWSFLKDANGKPTGMVSVASDISELKQTKNALLATENKYSSLVENSLDAIVIHQNAIIQFVNRAASRLTGYSIDEFINRNIFDFVMPEYQELVSKRYADRLAGKDVPSIYEIDIRKKDSSVLSVEINVSIFTYEGKPAGLIFMRDITERKRIAETLKKNEERYRSFVEQSTEGIFRVDMDEKISIDLPIEEQIDKFYDYGYVGECNNVMAQMYGYSKSENLIGKRLIDLHGGRDNPVNRKGQREFIQAGYRITDLETEEIDQQGNKKYFLNNAVGTIKNRQFLYTWGTQRDITDRKLAEKQIQQDLKEKNILLKEIHHRVKNNLQIISSLLGLQSRYIDHPHSLELFKESQERIRSMALVHEKLYQSEDFTKINFSDYIENLANNLYRTYKIDSRKISLNVMVKHVNIDVDMAIPCGLIINELISNSLKHAFPPSFKGKAKIDIGLYAISENTIELIVKDNGIGIPKNIDIDNADSLGLRLVHILANDQLQGKIEVNRNKGVKFKIQFTLHEKNEANENGKQP